MRFLWFLLPAVVLLASGLLWLVGNDTTGGAMPIGGLFHLAAWAGLVLGLILLLLVIWRVE